MQPLVGAKQAPPTFFFKFTPLLPVNVAAYPTRLSPVVRLGQLVFYGTFNTNRLYHAIEDVSHSAGGEHKYHAIKQ